MRIQEAKEAAREWVREQVEAIPGFQGAFTHGSINWLADDAVLPPTSDVDVLLVVAGPEPPVKPGKLAYRGALLEVSYLPQERLETPKYILGDYSLAGSFSRATILADPFGRLGALQAAVATGYAQRPWVYARCQDAQAKVLRHLGPLHKPAPLHDWGMAWLFAAGVTTHVLLVAGLCNPTVRRRYVAARELLAEYGHAGFYPRLLELLGCVEMSRAQVKEHLAAMADVFDAAAAAIKTPFPFAADISDSARAVPIDGSREMIEAGDHREALFWIAVTYTRCLKVLHHDAAPEVQERFAPGYRRLLADLGVASPSCLQRRGEEVRVFLPRLWRVAEAIIAANPDVLDPELAQRDDGCGIPRSDCECVG